MSKLIKSASIVLDSHSYSISPEITRPHSDGNSGGPIVELGAGGDNLIRQAEDAALAILEKAEKQAEEIIAEAREQAAVISEEAKSKAEEIYENQRAEAQEEGFNQGFDVGQSEAQVLIDEALLIKEEWTLNREKFISKMESDVIELCLKSVKNIINREISDESYILDIIRKGIENITYTVSLTVRVSDFDYDYVASNKSKILAMIEGIEDIEIKKDLSLDHSDCIIDSDTGSIDVGIESQFTQLQKVMNSLLAGESYD